MFCCWSVFSSSLSSGVTRFGLFPSPDISFPRSPGCFSWRMKSLETKTWALRMRLHVFSSSPVCDCVHSHVYVHRCIHTQAHTKACARCRNLESQPVGLILLCRYWPLPCLQIPLSTVSCLAPHHNHTQTCCSVSSVSETHS